MLTTFQFLLVHLLLSVATKDVLSAVSSSISVFGIPDGITSDDCSQYMAKVYHDFAARYRLKFTISCPYYSRGHGFIERQVQTINNVLNRYATDGSDPDLAVLQLTATPLERRTSSSDELLHNRQLKATLPSVIILSSNSEGIRALF